MRPHDPMTALFSLAASWSYATAAALREFVGFLCELPRSFVGLDTSLAAAL